jgi:hypothetical protein
MKNLFITQLSTGTAFIFSIEVQGVERYFLGKMYKNVFLSFSLHSLVEIFTRARNVRY